MEIGVSLSAMVISLFLQPIFGALVGIMVHNETLNAHQVLGGAIILSALAVGSLSFGRNPAR